MENNFGGYTLSAFAHELREPLASILLAAQTMSEHPGEEPVCRGMCEIIERQSRFLARVIEDALDVQRGSQQSLTLRKEWFDLRAVLASGLESVRPQFRRCQHRVSATLPQEPIYVLADAARVQQIVINLLANAAKYTPPGGDITFEVVAADGLTVIKVGDNGIGIAPDELPQVFEMFRRVGSPRADRPAGLGVGLALVKEFAERHGGSVQAHSEGEGKGSVFSVQLPLTASRVSWRRNGGGTFHAGMPADSGFLASPMRDA